MGVDATIGKAYGLSGAQAVTFDEVIGQTGQALGVKRLKVHVPIALAFWAVRLSRYLPGKTFASGEQILRLNEDKSFDDSEAQRDFNFSRRPFPEGIWQEVVAMYNRTGPESLWRDLKRHKSYPCFLGL